MIRPILFLSLAAAGLILAACDETSILAQAEPGECYQVTGKDSLGKAQLAKTDCSAAPEATVAADGSPAAELVAGTTTEASAQCPDPQAARALAAACAQLESAQAGAPTYIESSSVRPKVAASAATTRRRAAATQTASSGSSGAASSSSSSETSGSVRQFASGQYDQSDYLAIASQSSYAASSSASFSASSSSSSSYSYGAGYGYQQVDCQCDGAARGPRSPFDQNGFLTWPGKVPVRLN